ncbi:glutamate synthase subunit beta [Halonatronum saccharophilum]|uniref:glutamate synthase subunit beta n=1 Tax=Halonatronum saccharophilum TaxID=150060 RepID=UPI00048021CA|nr:glutamate synthase subunit beta [Halonatronum saccharophilum]
MGELGGFLKYNRKEKNKRSVQERVKDYKEVYKPFGKKYLYEQSSRCMDCGVPFCNFSCPVDNLCPEWNDFVSNGEWEKALEVLEETNNFPDFTGRLCPAPCEGGCVLGINDLPVTIKNIELAISEKGWEEGWIKAKPPKVRTGKKVAVVGSGPAGLAAAQELNRKGHYVSVFERDDKAGGMLVYGIPDFKIEKWIVQRRVDQLREEGVEFILNTEVGKDYPAHRLEEEYDAVVLAGGAREARDLPVYGRDLKGIHYAMEYLTQQNGVVAGKEVAKEDRIEAKGKKVLVIGGGDTGADCVGTATRQGAEAVYQIELLEKPSKDRTLDNPWPQFPQTLKVSTSHQEAEVFAKDEDFGVREWSIATKRFLGDKDGKVKSFEAVRVSWIEGEDGRKQMEEIEGSEFSLDVDLVLLAIGFVHPEHEGMLEELGLDLDERGNVKADNYRSNKDQIFVAGDMHRGASLIVWAIVEGREVAERVDEYLLD